MADRAKITKSGDYFVFMEARAATTAYDAIPLQEATATFHQGNFGNVDQTIDGIEHGNNGWGVYGQQNQNQTAVFQTSRPLDASRLVFEINQTSGYGAHKMQRFRLSYTTDANPTATDGSIVWTELTPTLLSTSLAGSSATLGPSNIISVTGSNAVPDTYQAIVDGLFGKITGFRLEAFTGPNGTIGFAGSNGNIVLSEFNVFATPIPEPATVAIWSLLAGLGIAAGWWRRRGSRPG